MYECAYYPYRYIEGVSHHQYQYHYKYPDKGDRIPRLHGEHVDDGRYGGRSDSETEEPRVGHQIAQ